MSEKLASAEHQRQLGRQLELRLTPRESTDQREW